MNHFFSKYQGEMYATFACFFSASIWIFVKELSDTVDVNNQIFYRLVIGTVILFSIFNKKIDFKKYLEMSLHDFTVLVIRGISIYVAGTTLVSLAINKTSYGIVVLILSIPFATLLALFLLKEKINMRGYFALILSIIGIYLSVKGRFDLRLEVNFGVLKSFSASILMAFGILARRFQSSFYNEIELTSFLLGISSFLYFLKMSLFSESVNVDFPLKSWLLLLLSGVWTVGFIFFIAKSLMKTSVLRANVIFGFQPILGCLIGAIMYKESFSINTYFGVLAVSLSVFFLNYKRSA